MTEPVGRSNARLPMPTRRGVMKAATALAGLSIGRRAHAAAAAAVTTVVPGSLTIAMNGDMPMDSVDNGELIGTDGEIIALIARKLGLKPAPALMDWSATIESVRSGRADIVMGNMGWSAPRAQALLMTDAIYYMGKYMLMRQSTPFGETMMIPEMAGHSVGAVSGGVGVPDLKRVPGVTELKLYDTTDSCVRDIRAGRVDLGVLDGPTVIYMSRQNADWGLKVSLLQPSPGYTLIGRKQVTSMGMSAANPDLFDAVNAGIAWAWATKANATILKKYGLDNPDNLVALDPNPRLGVDRDAAGNPIGMGGHTPKDYSAVFAANSQ